jgi:hypothetical protein
MNYKFVMYNYNIIMENEILCSSLQHLTETAQLNTMNVLGDMIVNIDTTTTSITQSSENVPQYSNAINYYVGYTKVLNENSIPELTINNQTIPIAINNSEAIPAFSFQIDGETIPYGTYLVNAYVFISLQQEGSAVSSGTQCLFSISAGSSPTDSSINEGFNVVSITDNSILYSTSFQTVITVNQYSTNNYVIGSVWTNTADYQDFLFDHRINATLVRIA